MQSPPFPRYLVPLRSKYSPHHHVLKQNITTYWKKMCVLNLQQNVYLYYRFELL